MKKILFVDDDEVTHKMVRHSLSGELPVISCFSLAEADKILESETEIAAVIIDRGLPDGDGISLCTRVRGIPHLKSVPIIFLSSASAETDKVGAFFAGADDYVTKPFGLLELKARIQARLRNRGSRLALGNLEINIESQRASFREGDQVSELDLTRTEFKILVTLMQSPDQVFGRESLLDKVWGVGCHVSDRVVDSHVSHLRRKISHTGVLLESLRGEGYRLTSAPTTISRSA